MEQLRVIIAGGGTGGHIFPAIAIGKALQRLSPGAQLLFVGAAGKMEMEKVPQEGFEIIGLNIAGFNRTQPWKNVSLPFKILQSRMKARSILATFRPHAVVGVGGYASFPMLSAAQAIGVPTLIQEQNSYAGKSNKMLARRAEAICVAYDQMDKFFPKEKLTLTGNPVRKEISTSNITNSAALALFGLKPDVSTILVVGGSQGAKSINEAIDGGLDALMQTGAQLIWQTGNSYYSRAAERAAKYGKAVFVSAFIKDMAAAYAAANVVVSRAGALAIAELCIAGKPVIFVPYPFAAEDHQTSNAMAIVNNKGALLVKDNDAAATLVPRIATLLADNVLQNTMAGNINKMAIKNADERIAYKIMSIAKGAS